MRKHLANLTDDAARATAGDGYFVKPGCEIEKTADKILDANRVGSGLAEDSAHRAASYLSKEQLLKGKVYEIVGNDKKIYTLLQVQGQFNGKEGIFEYILNEAGQVTHQRFIQNGIFTGIPNQTVPKGGA